MQHGGKRRSKAKNLLRHSFWAALFRYHLRLTQSEREHIIHQIQTGTAEFIRAESNRVSLWFVTSLGGIRMRIVYDKMRKAIVTVLPLDDEHYEFADEWMDYYGLESAENW